MRIFDHTLFINMKKILAASSACSSPEKLNAAQHSQSCDIKLKFNKDILPSKSRFKNYPQLMKEKKSKIRYS